MTLILALLTQPTLAAINVEEIRVSPEEEGVSMEIEVSASHKSGNVSFASVGTGAGVGYRRGDNMAFLIGSYTYASKRSGADLDSDGTLFDDQYRYTNKGALHARYNRNITENFALELFSQVEFNQFLNLDLRLLGGTGGRLRILKNASTTLHTGLGAMLESERYNPEKIVAADTSTLLTRATTYLSLNHALSNTASLILTGYYQPVLTAFSDYRVLLDTELEVQMTEKLSLAVSFSGRLDAQPPKVLETETTIRPLDTATSTSLKVTF
jgi:hypothetical protein